MSRLKARALPIVKGDRWTEKAPGGLDDNPGKNPKFGSSKSLIHGQSGRINDVLERGFFCPGGA